MRAATKGSAHRIVCVLYVSLYTTTMPQPTDPSTPAIFWMTMALKFGLPIIGWIITLVAMRSCPLTKEEMVNVQKRIAEKKAAAQSEFYKEQLQ